MKNIGIGLMGFGTVGKGVYKILQENKENISKRLRRETGDNYNIEIKKVFVRNLEKHGADLKTIGTTDFNELINNDIDIVVEVMGGSEPAISFMKTAMDNKKHVVTANKKALFEEGGNLEEYALKNGVFIRYEAAVGGAMPIVRILKEAQISDDLEELSCIINGSTNYILTRVSEGEDLDNVIADASKLGYLESDPTSDLEGFDPMYKLGILGYLVTGKYPKEEEIKRTGITKITKEELDEAKEQGYVIKLVGSIKKAGDTHKASYTYSVEPKQLSSENLLYGVNGSLNGVNMKFKYANDMFLVGRGAGMFETGTAVVSDIVSIIKEI